MLEGKGVQISQTRVWIDNSHRYNILSHDYWVLCMPSLDDTMHYDRSAWCQACIDIGNEHGSGRADYPYQCTAKLQRWNDHWNNRMHFSKWNILLQKTDDAQNRHCCPNQDLRTPINKLTSKTFTHRRPPRLQLKRFYLVSYSDSTDPTWIIKKRRKDWKFFVA